ncbi:MAG: lysylphosphatidylglycerol synthase domain-containing protein, partial [Alphaproteobacteria bacterium]
MWRLVLKGAVSGVLIWLLVSGVDLADLWEQLARVGAGDFLVAVALLGALSVPAAARWRGIVAALGAALPLVEAWRIVMVGLFFNQTLPSTIGGDAMRIWQARGAGLDLRR